MSELPDYDGPPKYLLQRDSPLEIPIEVIKNLFCTLDDNADDRVSLEELVDFVHERKIPFKDEEIVEMFKDAVKGRGVIRERHRMNPLTIDEIAAAVRGRH